MKLFFYVQHLLGIGHLKRAATLCRALAGAGVEVTLASGGRPVRGLALDGVKLVQLPSVAAQDASFKVLVDESGRPVTAEWRRERARRLLDAWRVAGAQALVIELFPFGRRQMRFELLPLLEEARAAGAFVACSVRDVLQPKPAHEEEMLAVFERYFDRLLVHADPRVAPFELSFAGARRLGGRLRYTGYVVEPPAAAGGEAGRGEVLVSAGGGAVGERLLATALEARSRTSLRRLPWRVLTGFATPSPRAGVEEGVIVEPGRADFPVLLRNCELSISQAGYNTVMETLQAGARAVLVPFCGGGEKEQTLRARAFAERGLVEMLDEAALSPAALAAAVERAAARARAPAPAVDLDGARRSAALLRDWLA